MLPERAGDMWKVGGVLTNHRKVHVVPYTEPVKFGNFLAYFGGYLGFSAARNNKVQILTICLILTEKLKPGGFSLTYNEWSNSAGLTVL
jgi:hypothetical protein